MLVTLPQTRSSVRGEGWVWVWPEGGGVQRENCPVGVSVEVGSEGVWGEGWGGGEGRRM